MNAGKTQIELIPANVLWDDYYENLHSAYNAMRDAYATCSAGGLTQDDIAIRLDVDKSLISRRLNGTENLTLKSISYMASAMKCRLMVAFVPYACVGTANYYAPTVHHYRGSSGSSTSTVMVHGSTTPVSANSTKELELIR